MSPAPSPLPGLPKTGPKVGVIFNPRSHRNRQAVDAAHALPNVIVASPAKRGELRGVLAGFAEQGVECIAISGGDGTVRDVLTAGMPVFGDRWPPLAVIPAGKTNALNVDLGAPKHWTLAEAVASLVDGERIVRRPLVVRDLAGGGELVGFVLGAGLFTVAVGAGQDAHRLGAFDSLAILATAAWGLVQAIFGSSRNPWRRGAAMRVRTGAEDYELPRSAKGDPARRAMLGRLAEGERNLTELAAPLRMSFPAASKHVRVLESARLVSRRVVGRTHLCRIEAGPLADATGWLEECRRLWEANFQRLDALLDEMKAKKKPKDREQGRDR